ncbi:hypothetical protein [Streptomyces sp. NPDC045251]|uniref:hypothetical protein n=1 Tax=unclassified Streptomyces TaxID=2593676 RepID=UPI0033C18124
MTPRFYPGVPEDFPTADRAAGFGDSRPQDPALLCQRVFIGRARPGLVFVGNPASGTASARLTLDGRTVRTAEVLTLPESPYRAFALPITEGETIASVDAFDGQGNRLPHDETYWD